MNKYNSEGYPDPTAAEALENVMRWERAQSHNSGHERVFVCSPYSGQTETEVADNVRMAIGCCQAAIKQGYLPVCPHIYFTRFLNDNDAAERRLGLTLGLELLRDCREIWVCGGRVSEGMKNEMAEAKRLGITVKFIDNPGGQGNGNR